MAAQTDACAGEHKGYIDGSAVADVGEEAYVHYCLKGTQKFWVPLAASPHFSSFLRAGEAKPMVTSPDRGLCLCGVGVQLRTAGGSRDKGRLTGQGWGPGAGRRRPLKRLPPCR